MTDPYVAVREGLFREYTETNCLVDAPVFRSVDQLSGAVADIADSEDET